MMGKRVPTMLAKTEAARMQLNHLCKMGISATPIASAPAVYVPIIGNAFLVPKLSAMESASTLRLMLLIADHAAILVHQVKSALVANAAHQIPLLLLCLSPLQQQTAWRGQLTAVDRRVWISLRKMKIVEKVAKPAMKAKPA
jgi:hypothetical protein